MLISWMDEFWRWSGCRSSSGCCFDTRSLRLADLRLGRLRLGGTGNLLYVGGRFGGRSRLLFQDKVFQFGVTAVADAMLMPGWAVEECQGPSGTSHTIEKELSGALQDEKELILRMAVRLVCCQVRTDDTHLHGAAVGSQGAIGKPELIAYGCFGDCRGIERTQAVGHQISWSRGTSGCRLFTRILSVHADRPDQKQEQKTDG